MRAIVGAEGEAKGGVIDLVTENGSDEEASAHARLRWSQELGPGSNREQIDEGTTAPLELSIGGRHARHAIELEGT